MDSNTPASPASSSASDSDAFNTESARVYFGPFKTPERKFITASKSLFPPPQPPAVRRSPRLSSPRLRSASPMDVQASEEDIKDIEQVAQLVNDSDEDERDSGMGTPQPGEDNLPDEPSSALADRIIHALDNPSPPPSPPSTLRIFDPYHATAPDGPTDYHTDLMSLKINDNVEMENAAPFLISPRQAQPISSSPSTTPFANDAAPECLITFDSLSTPRKQHDSPNEIIGDRTVPPNESTLSVDDLLSQSPSIVITPTHQLHPDASEATLKTTKESTPLQDESSMHVDDPKYHQESTPAVVITTSPAPAIEDSSIPVQTKIATQLASTEELAVTPLRRSTRPRRSITPIPVPNPTPLVFAAPPSIARTQVKKKISTPSRDDEVVSDSQDEQEDVRRSPSPSNTVRVRHRSPGKVPLSFRRELGSLSPTSSNVLSTLAFAAVDDPINGNNITMPTSQAGSSSQQPMFSFSVFTPPTEAPSTPARSTGPMRIASPAKPVGSSNKYRIQTPVIGDPTNTPARRIPISQGIAQGHVSPEKAVQLGFSANGTPLPSVSTPARRVPISHSAAPALLKSSNLRPASPVKRIPGQREPSVEPTQRFATSLKGKEKASQMPQERTAALPKLPFPLLPSTYASSSQPVPFQDTVQASKSSPVKSTLKQPTSRIPRIGVKPYARAIPKGTQKATTTTTTAEHVKPLQKPVDGASVARKNAREGVKSLASSTSSRVKPTTSTSLTTTLKRKREGDMTSPAKPRVIILRQVPPLATPPIETLTITQPPAPTSTASSKGKKPTPAPAPVRMRRVVDAEPTIFLKPPATQKPLPQPDPEPVVNTSAQQPSEAPSLLTDSLAPQATDSQEFPPGSPMKQDPAEKIQKEPEQSAADPTNVPGALDDTAAANSAIAGLRRTTRSRRSTATQDVFTEGSSRTSSTRRKAPVSRSDDVFSGMSMTALKDLTVSNTVKNQRYITAKLETEVIRKEGTRPESPAVKIRTIVQRQQEERDRERAARANRRARRSGEDLPSSDIEGPNGPRYSDDLMSEDEAENLPVRHTRGAGEDDDYETPDRYKHIRPMRLFGASGEEKDAEQLSRRVKWDRGLFTTVYLDEVKLGTRQTLKENRALKGILAPTAKALRLDTLGNLPHVDSPLGDIVQENITVKKIVYDSDVAAAVAEVAAAAKNTRSKSKKK